MRKIRVLQVCDHLGWEGSRMHGVKRLFAWMIPRFDPARFDVSLVSLRKKDLSEETLDALGIDITYLHKSKFDPSTLPALLKIIDRKKIDVLHLHGYGATTFGRMAAAMRGIPAILHEHANLTDTPWFQKIADRLLERYTDIAIAVSKSTADFVVKARLVQPEKVKVVYLGAPHDEFSRPRSTDEIAAARRELGIAPDDFAIGTVTRLHDSKGNSYLVDAARLVLDRKPNAKFFLVGEGPLRESLEAQARELGLGDRFVFVGFARDVAAVLSAFDLSVFPSLWEGTPLTAFEALASGKPIVATDADGLLDILTDGRDARIVPKRNARALADAIVDLIDHPDERARLAAAARVTAQRYDITAFVRKMEQLYVLLCDGSRATNAAEATRAAARRLVVPRMRVAVVTSTPLFVEGGHLVMARALVQALRDEGHEAELVLTPQNRFGRQGAAYLATWLTDVGIGDGNKSIDQVISLRYPSYAVRHPNHVVWLNHTMREYDDQWEAFSAPLSWKGAHQGRQAPATDPHGRSLAADEERAQGVCAVAHHCRTARAVGPYHLRDALSAATAARVSLRRLRRLYFCGVAARAAEAPVAAD